MSVELLQVTIVAVIVIVVVNSVASRLGVAGPLLLVLVGVGISVLPMVPPILVQPQLILVGVLPPLLYSAAVSAPAIELRRDFGAISGMAVMLVVISSLVLGCFFSWAIPSLGFPLAVALGAILSPTDAVATSIVRKLGVPRRVVALLEGESLLNDATALVLLRTAIAATAASFSIWSTLGSFAWAVLSASVIGVIIGYLTLRARAWIDNSVANTAMGFTVPYLAYLPTEAVGGSGLVAAVAAGVVVGQGAIRWLTPEQRISDKLNWRTIEFVFEGAVFLIMGLELYGILESNRSSDGGVWRGMWIAAVALIILISVRAAYVAPLIRFHTWRVKKNARTRLSVHEDTREPARYERATRAMKRATRISPRGDAEQRAGKTRADIDYFEASPLTWKPTVIIVWAGMRGVVTLAAAQTLPRDTPERDLLVLVAFLVAAGSLLVQGLTLPALTRWLGLRDPGGDGLPREEIRELGKALRDEAATALGHGQIRRPDRTPLPADILSELAPATIDPLALTVGDPDPRSSEVRLAILVFMRQRLHQISKTGQYSTTAIRYVLDELDASELSVRLRLGNET
ncbi:cation:proton antiporter [Microbacterium sp. R86528]|uniref:cation:proton antiporter n=1 Tax=Microbacterium sp. R86528 TaxID=3093864 RepID=UPI0037C4F896